MSPARENESMSNEVGTSRSWIVTFFAVSLAILGLVFLFAPQEMGVTIFGRNDVEPMMSLLGGAIVSFGVMNWIARKSALGGIYGRIVVAPNQAHFVIGSLVLLKHGAMVGGTGLYWALCAFYVAGAIFFSFLLFGSGMKPPAGGRA
jgi:hypothetical protein